MSNNFGDLPPGFPDSVNDIFVQVFRGSLIRGLMIGVLLNSFVLFTKHLSIHFQHKRKLSDNKFSFLFEMISRIILYFQFVIALYNFFDGKVTYADPSEWTTLFYGFAIYGQIYLISEKHLRLFFSMRINHNQSDLKKRNVNARIDKIILIFASIFYVFAIVMTVIGFLLVSGAFGAVTTERLRQGFAIVNISDFVLMLTCTIIVISNCYLITVHRGKRLTIQKNFHISLLNYYCTAILAAIVSCVIGAISIVMVINSEFQDVEYVWGIIMLLKTVIICFTDIIFLPKTKVASRGQNMLTNGSMRQQSFQEKRIHNKDVEHENIYPSSLNNPLYAPTRQSNLSKVAYAESNEKSIVPVVKDDMSAIKREKIEVVIDNTAF